MMVEALQLLAIVFIIAAAMFALTKRKRRGEKPRSAQWLAALWTPDRSTPHALRGKASGASVGVRSARPRRGHSLTSRACS